MTTELRESRHWEAVEKGEGVTIATIGPTTRAKAVAWMADGKRSGYVKLIGHTVELEFRDGVGDTPEGWQ